MKSVAHSIPKIGGALLAIIFISSSFTPTAQAASKLEVSGWLPYWRSEAGTDDVRDHIEQLYEINPFGYTVRTDGSLFDAMGLSEDEWEDLFEDAEDEGVKIIPTIMWSDTENIHRILSNPILRAAHIKSIVSAVDKNDFDGVDIDYEAKKAETRVFFSAFIKELEDALDEEDARLNCTIEARMPLSARYSGTPPANIEYANDLPTLNRYCDRVRIMTYDQQTADIQLNASNRGKLYAPVSDVKWVEKVVNYMDDDISKRKLVIGIPTYGYIHQAMPNVSGTDFTYTKLEAFNPGYGTQIAKEYKLSPTRGASGELTLSYVPKEWPDALPSQSELAKLAPRGTSSGNLAAAGALEYAKRTGKQAPITYLTWSDSGAIKQKVDLAKKLGVKGVAVFKFDGGSDSKMWDALK